MHILKALPLKWIQWSVVFLLYTSPVMAMEQDVLTVAISRAPITLDARYATDAASIRTLRLLSQGLVELDENFNYVPALAREYTHDNFQTYNFVLKDLTFSDGQQLTAKDVQSFYQSMLKEGSGSPLSGALSDVKAITTLNDNQIRFHLNKPNPWFLTTLETPIFKINNGENRIENPVGISEMHFVKQDDTGSVWLQKGGKTLKLEVIQDPTVRVLKLMRGEVNVVYNDLPDELYKYAKENGYKSIRVPSASYTYIGFNLESGVTADKKVREALSYAINRPDIIENLLDGEGVLAHSLLLEDHPAIYRAKIAEYSPQTAVQLLKEAGYGVSESGFRLELSMSVTTDPFVLRIAQILQQELKEIGVQLNISSTEWGSFYGNIKKGNFESYILTWVGRFQPDIFYSLFHSSMKPPHGANRGRYDNPEMDRLLEIVMPAKAGIHDINRAEGTPFNMDEIYNAAIEVQKLQEEEKIYIPLWRRNHGVVMGKNITGCQIPADGGYEGLLACEIKKGDR